ncbi:histidine kinase [Microbacterium sp. P07]|uniref:histidine kinase n=1 Tax=Microbacterium sp. P07 TaxID=3366952 RepID=UPI0037465866
MREGERTRGRRSPRVASRLARSIVPLALGGNAGAYLLGLYLVEYGRSAADVQNDAWQLVTVLALVSFQAVWLVWLRSQPIGTLTGSLVLWIAAVFVGGYEPVAVQPGLLFAVFAFMTERTGAIRSLAIAFGTAVSTIALVGAYALRAPAHAPAWNSPALILSWLVVALATIALPALAGSWYANLRDRAERIAELAEQVASGEAIRTAEAVAAERRTLAQELHDTSSAHLAALLALSTAAETSALGGGRSHKRVVVHIRDEGQRLYQGFERMLNSMRTEDRTVTESFQSGYRPGQHSVREISSLVQEHRELTGAPVSFEHDPELSEIDQRIGPMRAHIAYRVVQEGLSNARKHAPGAEIIITMEDDGATLLLRVENGAPPAPTGKAAGVGARTLSLGYGLDGMRDRLLAAGGSLRTGPRGAGGWSINALVPHPPHQRAAERSRLSSHHLSGAPGPGPDSDTDLFVEEVVLPTVAPEKRTEGLAS